jgi:hypothetical protein
MQKKILMMSAVIILLTVAPLYAFQVSFLVGDVTISKNGKKTTASVGALLAAGDVIRTGKDSFVEIQDDNQSVIKIMPLSIATIGSKQIAESDSVSLVIGDLLGSFKKLIKGSNKIYSPTTIAAVRGTEFTVNVSTGGDTRINLAEGGLDIANPYGKTVMRPSDTIESRIGEGPRTSAGTPEEWKKKNAESFAQNPGAKADDTGKYLGMLNDRAKETGGAMASVRSAIKEAANEKSLEKAESLLNSTEEKTVDDLYLNESLGQSLKNIMENFSDKDPALYSKFKSAFLKSNIVAVQHQKNLTALKKIREDYQKAYERIMGRYKSKTEEIKSRFKDKKSGI